VSPCLPAFFLYLAAGILWAWCLWKAKISQEGSVQKIHYLMAVLISFKCLTVLCQSGMYHLIRTRGREAHKNKHSTDVQSMINRNQDVRKGEGECLLNNGLGVGRPPRSESVRQH